MKKKMIFCFVFLSSILVLPVISIHANETVKPQKQAQKKSAYPIHHTIEEINLDTSAIVTADELADNNFLGMDKNDIVFQINNGGFLFSTIQDSETVKRGYLESNPGDKLTAMTVSEAKEYYRNNLENYYASLKKER